MSEDFEPTKVKTLKVTVDRNPEIESLRQELENERLQKLDLEAKMTIIAEKEFAAKKSALEKQYGVNLDYITTSNPEELVTFEKSAKLLKSQSQPQQFTPMSAPSQPLNLPKQKDEEYNTIEDLIVDLQAKARPTNPDKAEVAVNEAILNELTKKVVSAKGKFNYELDSGFKSLAQRPSRAEGEPIEAFNKRLDEFKRNIKFKKISGDE